MNNDQDETNSANKMVAGWRHYKQAIVPTTAPHEEVNLSPIEDGSVWKINESNRKPPLFARWTSDFDCEEETNWWYCIKDSPFDISTIKSKLRYVIKQGMQHFDVRRINPAEYAEELYDITRAAFCNYPAKYRPSLDKKTYMDEIKTSWGGDIVYGAFSTDDKKLCGFSMLEPHGIYISFAIQKVDPRYEKLQINAALVNQILVDFNSKLSEGYYICDGERNTVHETAFQAYLCKYFGFRKAYCRLHIKYRPIMKIAITILYPFRKILQNFDKYQIIHNVSAVLKMEEISRNSK